MSVPRWMLWRFANILLDSCGAGVVKAWIVLSLSRMVRSTRRWFFVVWKEKKNETKASSRLRAYVKRVVIVLFSVVAQVSFVPDFSCLVCFASPNRNPKKQIVSL